MAQPTFSTRDVAVMLNIPAWRVSRLYEDNTLPEPPARIGRNRVIAMENLPAILDALAARGWLVGPIKFPTDTQAAP